MDEIKKFTDIRASYSVYEKSGKTVTKIKFQITPNQKNIADSKSPRNFKDKIQRIADETVDLSDPIFSNEIYQLMAIYNVELQKDVRIIVEKCGEDENYKLYVKDTITRCKKDFERNPSIKNTGGYIVAAILKNYHKKARETEEEKKQKENTSQTDRNKLEKINTLVKE